ncbi:MAG: histidinol phosphate phosphatase [Alphaproteobacteria bacterium]|nr:histidinol phosphate phosphatase [Alphaproteobacteria bacterium]
MAGACPPDLVAFADRLGDAARRVIRRRFRTPIAVDIKADASPVTLADKEAEQAIRRLIGRHYPSHGIQGEEFGISRPEAEWRWIVDPIDGTKSFMTGSPLFGTLIALMRRGRPVLGLMEQPILEERWLAHGGQPTTLNGQRIRPRRCPRLAEAVLYTSGLEYFQGHGEAGLRRLMAECRLTRFSADCYALGLMTLGFVDLVIEPRVHPHDYAALVPIVENAGGAMTDWQGRKLGYDRVGDFVAVGDRRLLAPALALLAG